MAESRSVVYAALVANGAIAILKFFGFLITGSPSMLSETYHSVSDTGNQVFLLIGIRYGEKAASASHPFGYGKAQFFYSFLVAVLLFGIAGWESANHGYHALRHPSVGFSEANLLGYRFPGVYVNFAVLLSAIAFESWAFMKAYRSMEGQIEKYDWSGFREAFQKTSDVTVLTALTEDAIALAGAAIALVGVYLTWVTRNPVYDAAAALLIGLLLMGFALALAWENKRLLLGESLPKTEEARLSDIVARHDGVAGVDEFRSVYFGPERVLVTADVSFDPGLDTGVIDGEITEIETELQNADGRVEKVYIEPEL